jgi:cytochrome c-type biogenesis protein CcsB
MTAKSTNLIQIVLPVLLIIGLAVSPVWGQTAGEHDHDHAASIDPRNVLGIPDGMRQDIGKLIIQDYQGRMKPVDTLARELIRKTTKKENYKSWAPLDLFLSWIANPQFWWHEPILYVRHPGLKKMLNVAPGTRHVSPQSLFDEKGGYLLGNAVAEAHRTPDRDRSKVQRKLIAFDERLNLAYLTLQGENLRIYPIPGDPKHSWTNGNKIAELIPADLQTRYQEANNAFRSGIVKQDLEKLRQALSAITQLQTDYGAEVLLSPSALKAELMLNRSRIFTRVVWSYFLASVLLLTAYFWSLGRRKGRPFSWKHPFYAIGMVIFAGSFLVHVAGYTLRWIASGRAPLSNGFESLLFISLAVAAAGLIYESRDRRGSLAGVSSLLTFVVLGISMASFFDPAIGMLVPVLASVWLIIHVTVITASYGFLGLGAILGGLILILFMAKGRGRDHIREGIIRLEKMLYKVLVAGLGLLAIGTLLGGVWANESWGRYWGWDPKETWSLVTILVYAAVLHCRFVKGLRSAWLLAAGSFIGIASVVMTYFGVNYFLSGLHSYAEGGVAQVPNWVYIGAVLMCVLVGISYLRHKFGVWEHK